LSNDALIAFVHITISRYLIVHLFFTFVTYPVAFSVCSSGGVNPKECHQVAFPVAIFAFL
jgi:hypothetical protein